MSLDDVVARVREYGCDVVEITGGEPLLQKEVYPLMQRLLDEGRTVMLETGGHISVDQVPEPVIRVIDVKCPGSGEAGSTHWPNLEQLRPTDEVKFVIKDRADYEYARDVVAQPSSDRPMRGGALLAGARRAEPPRARRMDPGGPARRPPPAPGAQVHLGSLDAGACEGHPAAERRTRFLHGRRDRAVGRIRAVRADDPLRAGPRASRSRRRGRWRRRWASRGTSSWTIPLSKIGGSALVGDGEIPKDRSLTDEGIPSTYVPARNTVFLSLALAWAEVVGAEAIVIGVNALDYSGYPDCRPEYLARVRAARRAGDEGRRRRPAAENPHAAAAAVESRHHPPRPRARRRLRPDAQLLRSRPRRTAVRPLRQLPAARQGLCSKPAPPDPDISQT